jgi:hypothetical protein
MEPEKNTPNYSKAKVALHVFIYRENHWAMPRAASVEAI